MKYAACPVTCVRTRCNSKLTILRIRCKAVLHSRSKSRCISKLNRMFKLYKHQCSLNILFSIHLCLSVSAKFLRIVNADFGFRHLQSCRITWGIKTCHKIFILESHYCFQNDGLRVWLWSRRKHNACLILTSQTSTLNKPPARFNLYTTAHDPHTHSNTV